MARVAHPGGAGLPAAAVPALRHLPRGGPAGHRDRVHDPRQPRGPVEGRAEARGQLRRARASARGTPAGARAGRRRRAARRVPAARDPVRGARRDRRARAARADPARHRARLRPQAHRHVHPDRRAADVQRLRLVGPADGQRRRRRAAAHRVHRAVAAAHAHARGDGAAARLLHGPARQAPGLPAHRHLRVGALQRDAQRVLAEPRVLDGRRRVARRRVPRRPVLVRRQRGQPGRALLSRLLGAAARQRHPVPPALGQVPADLRARRPRVGRLLPLAVRRAGTTSSPCGRSATRTTSSSPATGATASGSGTSPSPSLRARRASSGAAGRAGCRSRTSPPAPRRSGRSAPPAAPSSRLRARARPARA